MSAAQYALVQNNTVTNVVIWDGVTPYALPSGVTAVLMSSLPAGAGVGWALSGGVWSSPAPIAQVTGLTFQQFCSLFTVAELNTIIAGCVTNQAILIGFLKLVSYSGNISLSSPMVIADVAGLVSLGMITSARQAQVLAGVVMNPQA